MAGEAGWLVRDTLDTVGTGLPFEAKRLVKGSCSAAWAKGKRQTANGYIKSLSSGPNAPMLMDNIDGLHVSV